MEKFNRNSSMTRKRLHQMIAIGIVTLAILIVLIIGLAISSKPSSGTGNGTQQGAQPTETESEISTEELRAKAKELHIRFTKSTSDDVLLEKIKKKKKL